VRVHGCYTKYDYYSQFLSLCADISFYLEALITISELVRSHFSLEALITISELVRSHFLP
jgi:hypothetical protein